MKLTLAKVLARKKHQVVLYFFYLFNSLPARGALLLSAYGLSKQFGPRSGPTFCRA